MDDKYNYEAAMKGADYLSVLDDMDEWLRRKNKYEFESYTEAELAVFQLCREELSRLRNDT
jgi:hypothetical protein